MKEPSNPYRPVGSPDCVDQLVNPDAPSIKPVSKVAMTLWVLVYSFPLLAIFSIYGCWLLAWATLGYQPKPMLNDPKYIGGPLDVAYFASNITIMLYPAIAPLGLISPFFCPAVQRSRIPKSLVLLAIYVAINVLGIVLVRSDPGSVVEWYLD